MTNSSESAFPLISPDGMAVNQGLTKREYFAGLAMQGMVSNRAIMSVASRPEQRDYLIKFSIEIADELLKQLESK